MNNPFQANHKTYPSHQRFGALPFEICKCLAVGIIAPKGELAQRPLSPMKSIRPKWKVQNGQMEMKMKMEQPATLSPFTTLLPLSGKLLKLNLYGLLKADKLLFA